MKEISYCPISREQYKAMKKFLSKEEIGTVLMEACEYFFSDTDYQPELKTRTEFAYFDLLMDFADEKYKAWRNSRLNFIENNPRKKQQ